MVLICVKLSGWKMIMKKFALLISIILLLTGCQAAEREMETETAVVPSPTSQPTSPPTATATQTPTPPPTTAPTLPPTPFTPPDIGYLQAASESTLADFPGLSSMLIIDLETGEQITHDPDLALAGTSLIKIPLLVETFRALNNPPGIEQTKLLTQTTSVSSNFAANLLLRDVVGSGDIFVGADILNQSMRDLGLYNTFIAVPYDLDPPPNRPQTYLTPANQRTDRTTHPDPFRQTTLGDLATLMTAIYTCAESNAGLLRDVYPDQITQAECQEILQLLTLNDLARLLENGLPEDVPFSQKVGWIDDTHGNIGIVYGPERDYLIGMALYAPGWLEWEDSAPLFEVISQLAYTHFNETNPYAADVLRQPPQLNSTPTANPTPPWPQAVVFGTQGIGLTLRQAPDGEKITILAEGTIISLLADTPEIRGDVSWRKVRTQTGEVGWVDDKFLIYD